MQTCPHFFFTLPTAQIDIHKPHQCNQEFETVFSKAFKILAKKIKMSFLHSFQDFCDSDKNY
jgi:hypothetical protein